MANEDRRRYCRRIQDNYREFLSFLKQKDEGLEAALPKRPKAAHPPVAEERRKSDRRKSEQGASEDPQE